MNSFDLLPIVAAYFSFLSFWVGYAVRDYIAWREQQRLSRAEYDRDQ